MKQKISKKLYRSRTNRIIFGICGGLAKHFNANSTLIRIIFILLIFYHGIGLFFYFVLMILVPLKPGSVISVNREEKLKEMVGDVKDKVKSLGKELKENKDKKK